MYNSPAGLKAGMMEFNMTGSGEYEYSKWNILIKKYV